MNKVAEWMSKATGFKVNVEQIELTQVSVFPPVPHERQLFDELYEAVVGEKAIKCYCNLAAEHDDYLVLVTSA